MTDAIDRVLAAGVDGIAVINLDRRPDRWSAFQAAWGGETAGDRLVRVPACDGVTLKGYGESPWFRGRKRDRSWAGRAGCALSHKQALALIGERGWRRALILEDDAVPGPGLGDGTLERALKREDWDLLYLGCQEARGPIRAAEPGLVWIRGALDAHAYVVDAALADWIVQRLPGEDRIWSWIAEQRAWDRWLRREIGREHAILACDPAIVVQAEGHSDISVAHRQDQGPPPLIKPSRGGLDDLNRSFEAATEGYSDYLRGRIKRMTGF
ncbi:MAG: glycosyl transferase [Phenylobacterium zucineum]|nr:MAG: glycosyl transferase [Phenylobacterium zucineum]